MFIVEVENTKTTGDININWGTFIIGTQQGVSHGKEKLKLTYSVRNSSAKPICLPVPTSTLFAGKSLT